MLREVKQVGMESYLRKALRSFTSLSHQADGWAKLASEEPDVRGVEGLEWMTYSDRPKARTMPLPRSLANIRRETSEKKWAEARK